VAKVEELRAALKEKDRELAQLNERMLELAALRVLDQVEQVGDSKLLSTAITAHSMDDLRTVVDILKAVCPAR